MIDNNPYVVTCASMDGITTTDVRRQMRNSVPRKREFPLTIHGVTFNTKREYQDALHEFLNGN